MVKTSFSYDANILIHRPQPTSHIVSFYDALSGCDCHLIDGFAFSHAEDCVLLFMVLMTCVIPKKTYAKNSQKRQIKAPQTTSHFVH
ncbi:hypothetical protein L596_021484 [Steinernema carpocapsae]|uniref:Uncharacterized protein n=1 Tax=Steinernema carpocapsae TaxID=34508 RepID=A0A4U5MIX8_STECR|nr:hypothetical protein L596_021484 [Steinernema carpocapsae]